MPASRKRLLTGLQPSGTLHIGNYFGALKPFLDRYEEFESFLMVADYHALTSLKKPEELREKTMDVVLDYLGIGIDPKKAVIFQQSRVQEHTELAWIFETLVTVPFLMQAHAYKDKTAKGMEANAGLFNYPMLMAADILLYDTDMVPVGKDQQQHIEYAREAAAKFNNTFGDTFKEPGGIILEDVGTVPGTDGQKMSKSYGNTIPLFGTKDEISKAVMSIVTDSNPTIVPGADGLTIGPANLWRIHQLFKKDAELETLYKTHSRDYRGLKEALIEDIEALVAPMRARRAEYAAQPEKVRAIVEEGSEKARVIASAKMKTVREKVGVTL